VYQFDGYYQRGNSDSGNSRLPLIRNTYSRKSIERSPAARRRSSTAAAGFVRGSSRAFVRFLLHSILRLRLRFCLPLHVRGRIDASPLQRNDMVNNVAGSTRRKSGPSTDRDSSSQIVYSPAGSVLSFRACRGRMRRIYPLPLSLNCVRNRGFPRRCDRSSHARQDRLVPAGDHDVATKGRPGGQMPPRQSQPRTSLLLSGCGISAPDAGVSEQVGRRRVGRTAFCRGCRPCWSG
jgi:hypothetical protein